MITVLLSCAEHSTKNKAVIHLVDWSDAPAELSLAFNPMVLVGTPSAEVTFIRPDAEPVVFPDYAGGSLTVDALNPWGILVVEATQQGTQKLSAPFITAPSVSIIPRDSVVSFNQPEGGHTLFARFVSDAEQEVPFRPVDDRQPLIVTGEGRVEAFIQNDIDKRKSERIGVPFKTFNNLSLSPSELAELTERQSVDLSGHFAISPSSGGEMKINASFHAAEMKLMQQRVERGFSTRGDVTLDAESNTEWKYFVVEVGIDDAEYRRPCARFQVLFDNVLVYETPIINPSKMVLAEAERKVLPIALRMPANTKKIQLRVQNGGFFVDQNTFIWAAPRAFL
jgi:hypothetical protein